MLLKNELSSYNRHIASDILATEMIVGLLISNVTRWSTFPYVPTSKNEWNGQLSEITSEKIHIVASTSKKIRENKWSKSTWKQSQNLQKKGSQSWRNIVPTLMLKRKRQKKNAFKKYVNCSQNLEDGSRNIKKTRWIKTASMAFSSKKSKAMLNFV